MSVIRTKGRACSPSAPTGWNGGFGETALPAKGGLTICVFAWLLCRFLAKTINGVALFRCIASGKINPVQLP